MYLAYFGLRKYPFSLTPDPDFLFLSGTHRAALETIIYGIRQRMGFIEVIGGVGTGKTTLSRAVMEELGEEVAMAFILNPCFDGMELLRAINQDFKLKAQGSSRKDLLDELNSFLLEVNIRGRNACLIVDECQSLRPDVLEEIRLLSNLETRDEKLIQIVLMGQPEFHDMLKSERLRALDERIQVRCFLEPLTKEETAAYVSHRLAIAGSRGEVVFTRRALAEIFKHSRGNPRRINSVCDRALLVAYGRGTRKVDEHIVRMAAEEVVGKRRSQFRGRARTKTAAIFLYCLLGLAGMGLGWTISQFTPLPDISRRGSKDLKAAEETSPRHEPDNSPSTAIQATASVFSPVFRRLGGLSGIVVPARVEDIREVAKKAGWEAVKVMARYEDLLRFKRACILEVGPGEEGGEREEFAVLRGISEVGVWVQQGESELRFVSRNDLEKVWRGAVWIWLQPPMANRKLTIGSGGEEVQRLQNALAKLGFWKGSPTGIYDWRTRRAVKDFQRLSGLEEDGKVGPQTLAMMVQLLGEEAGL